MDLLQLVFLGVFGVIGGILSGLVGVGGGVVMVPLMVLGMGIATKRAISTSLAVILFTGIVGATGYIATGFRGAEDLLSLPPLIDSAGRSTLIANASGRPTLRGAYPKSKPHFSVRSTRQTISKPSI